MTNHPIDGAGHQLRLIRNARKKSLTVIAQRADISASYLSRLENGERALDRRSLVVALANALEVAPSEITGAALAAPGSSAEDRSLNGVRLALLAVSMGEPEGEVVPVEGLRARVTALLDDQKDCKSVEVGQALPSLIRDLHTTLGTGHDAAELLKLLTLAHVQGTQAWLADVGANLDLAWQAVALAKGAAEQTDDPLTLALSAFGTAFGLMGAGAFDLASRTVSTANPGTATPEAMQAAGMLSLTSSLVAAARGDASERSAALDHAADLAAHTGEGNALWFGFGPSNVGVWQMSVALEAGDYAEAARIATTVHPEALPSPTRRSAYYRGVRPCAGSFAATNQRGRDDAAASRRDLADAYSPPPVHAVDPGRVADQSEARQRRPRASRHGLSRWPARVARSGDFATQAKDREPPFLRSEHAVDHQCG